MWRFHLSKMKTSGLRKSLQSYKSTYGFLTKHPSTVWQNSTEVCLSHPGQWRSFQNTWQITGQRWRGLWERTQQKSVITSIPAREPPSLQSRKPRKGKRNGQMHQKVQVERRLPHRCMCLIWFLYFQTKLFISLITSVLGGFFKTPPHIWTSVKVKMKHQLSLGDNEFKCGDLMS